MPQRTNDEWLRDLRAAGDQQTQALEELRYIILRGLPYAVAGRLASDCLEDKALMEEVVQVTLASVRDTLDGFDGCGAFTTWVQKIAVREALLQLRHKRWQETRLPGTKAGDATEALLREMPANLHSLETLLASSEFLQYLHRIIREELSAKQRAGLRAIVMLRMPKEEAMKRLEVDRETFFEMIHDARLRLKRRSLNDRMITNENR